MKRTFLLCATFAGLALGTGCQHPGPKFDPRAPTAARIGKPAEMISVTNHVAPELLAAPTNTFILGPGDKLEIELLSDPTSKTQTSVGPDGKIYFYLLPGIDVWGMSLPQAQARLEDELTKYIRDKPQVAISLRAVESRRIWILGRVQQPGVYPLFGPTTLIEAISLAGGTVNASSTTREITGLSGTEEFADLRHSFVMRQGKLLPVDFHRLLKEGDFSQNIYIQPDDFIYMPGAAQDDVYVMGAVLQPTAVPYNENTTLVSAITHSYGTVKDAYLSHVAIVRGSLSNPQIAIVDYKDVIKGKIPDVKLEARDIVYVPYTPYRILSRYADLIATTFVTSVAINEGSRAVLKSPPAATGILIPLGSRITVVQPGPPAIR